MKSFFMDFSVWLGSWTLTDIKTLTDIFQNITLIVAAVIAAWWGYVTLTYKDKTDELLAIARKIVEIDSFINGNATTYYLQKTIVQLTEGDDQQLKRFKHEAEDGLAALKQELQDLQAISLRVPMVFRFLNLTEYQSELIMLGDIENWNTEEVKNKLIKAKLQILKDIDKEVNAHGNLLKWVYIKFQNLIFRFRGK